MATHRPSIFGSDVRPDSSGDVFDESYTVKATNDVFKHGVWIFNNTSTKISLYGTFPIPKNYVGTASIKIVWSSTVTTGNCIWDFDYRSVGGDDTESLDQATFQESVTVTDAAPTAANNRLEASVNLTSANLAADDTLEWVVSRDGLVGAPDDTMAAAAMLVDVLLQYNDA